MRRNRVYAMCLAAVLTAVSLSGCGAGDTAADASVGKEPQEQQSGQAESGDITLRVWAGEEDKELIAVIADNFAKEHASEANITIEWEPMVEGECRSNLLGDVLNAPDVYTTTDGDIRTIAAGGAASEVMKPDEIKENNLASAVEAMTINNKIYGYPLTADNGYFLYYNKAYFSEEDVQDLDTILNIAAKNNKLFAMDWSSGWYLYSFFGQTGLKVGLNDDGVTNFCEWNNAKREIKGTDIAEALLKIAANPGFKSTPDWIKGIQSGDVIACVSGVWDESAIKAAWGSNYGAAKLPCYTVAGKKVQMACYFGYKMIGVNPYSEHIEWAHKFADYIANEENQVLRFQMRGQGPANLKAAETPEIQDAAAIQAVLEQSQYSELQRLGSNFWAASTTLGNTLAAGNPEHVDLQQLMDTAVEGITSSTVQ
ncbi:MAG: extracellular solute-binding protein [bacterium]|nr:extracellular solute-binding protein [bacterium]MDY4099725.1 extracellular solute-binding protein [Lachnospiraceae bacterium]